MTALLYVLLAIVIGVAIWQIASILNLKSVIATEKDNNTQGILFALFGIFFYGLMIFSFCKYSVILLPESGSLEGEQYDSFFRLAPRIHFISSNTNTSLFCHDFLLKCSGRNDMNIRVNPINIS